MNTFENLKLDTKSISLTKKEENFLRSFLVNNGCAARTPSDLLEDNFSCQALEDIFEQNPDLNKHQISGLISSLIEKQIIWIEERNTDCDLYWISEWYLEELKLNENLIVLKKGQKVTIISEKDRIITIQETLVLKTGEKETRFEAINTIFETPTIKASIEELKDKPMSRTYVVPNETFIEEYILADEIINKKLIKKIKDELKNNPESKRWKNHLEVHSKKLEIIDMRKNPQQSKVA